MTTLSKEQPVITLINTFIVKDKSEQEKLGKLLTLATNEVMNKLPGFVSANIHYSLDGTRVVNYAQWKTKDDFDSMLKNAEAQKHMKEAAAIAEKFEPVLYQLIYSDSI